MEPVDPHVLDRIVVIGHGLIGGSIALAAAERRLAGADELFRQALADRDAAQAERDAAAARHDAAVARVDALAEE